MSEPSRYPGELVSGILDGEPPLSYLSYLPSRGAERALVCVHGISENPNEHVDGFAGLAEQHGVALVAPHFASPTWRDFQRLGRAGKGPRADLALERLLASIGRLANVPVGRFCLFGFSGGGQFAHRYLMAHPERVVAAVVASAGWYTFPHERRRFPHGTRGTPLLPDLSFRANAFLRVPLLVTVGEHDVDRDGSLRRTARLDREQGTNRRERAKRFVSAMAAAASAQGLRSPVELRQLSDTAHSFSESVAVGGLAELVFAYLFERKLPAPARHGTGRKTEDS